LRSATRTAVFKASLNAKIKLIKLGNKYENGLPPTLHAEDK